MPSDLSPTALVVHHDRLCRAARSLSASPDDADDLVQDTYVSVLRKQRRLDSSGAELGYLLRALRNTHASNLRTRQRRPQTAWLAGHRPAGPLPTCTSPATVVYAREILRAIAGLPPEQSRTLAAVDVMGLSYTEAARALDIPLGTVMSRLHRGRDRLAKLMAA